MKKIDKVKTVIENKNIIKNVESINLTINGNEKWNQLKKQKNEGVIKN